MALDVKLRKEGPEDTRPVECLLREAFWTVYVPGCEEHYLAHILRSWTWWPKRRGAWWETLCVPMPVL